ncbi:MAG: hypothetical protein NXI32_22705 [bacterium]|nr:hypothetical protein [bacterium]
MKWLLHVVLTVFVALASAPIGLSLASDGHAQVTIEGTRWFINGKPTNADTPCEGLLMNVRMVNATFEDRGRVEFDLEKNTEESVARIGDYAACGVNAFTLCLQGGMPGYEGAVNSAFEPDGTLRPGYLKRVERLIRAWDEHGVVVILGLLYQRQSTILRDEATVRAGIINAVGLSAETSATWLVISRQTGGSGQWDYEEYLVRACDAVLHHGDD